MLCYYFPPCPLVGALRSSKFVKNLNDFGWASVVLSAYRGNRGEYGNDRDVEVHSTFRWDMSVIAGKLVVVTYFCINRLKRFVSLFLPESQTVVCDQSVSVSVKSKGGLGVATFVTRWLFFPDPQFLWLIFALPKALWLSRKCDVIYSSLSPFSVHVLGLIVKTITGKPWVADYRDEWSLNSTWKPPTRFHRWLGEKLDGICVKKADMVINVTEPRTEMFKDHFAECQDKFVTIHNGYDEEDVKEFRDMTVSEQYLTFTSIGSFYGGRDPRPFLRAVSSAIAEDKVDRSLLRIRLIGVKNPDLIKEVEKLKITDVVEIVPRIPQKEAFRALGQSHVAVLIGSDMEKVAMTTKVYEYAGMGKPILAMVPEGPVYDFVNRCGGWCAKHDDQGEIQEQFLRIYKMYQEGALKKVEITSFVKLYDRRELTSQLASCMFRVCE